MSKKMSPVSIVVGLVVLLALVYFFRPHTFNFLTQGFTNEGVCDDSEKDADGNCPLNEGFCDDSEKDADGNCPPFEEDDLLEGDEVTGFEDLNNNGIEDEDEDE